MGVRRQSPLAVLLTALALVGGMSGLVRAQGAQAPVVLESAAPQGDSAADVPVAPWLEGVPESTDASQSADLAAQGPLADAVADSPGSPSAPTPAGIRFGSAIDAAWFGAGASLAARANRAQVRALELGAPNLDAAARALVAPAAPGDPLANALVAVRLAPDLPVAHAALARAHWVVGEREQAMRDVVAALRAVPGNLEATTWIAGSLLWVFAAVLVLGSLGFILALATSVFSHAAHDLGDLFSHHMPAFARTALLGTLFLVPLLLGEGLLGLGLLAFGLAFAYGGARCRFALLLAGALIVLGLYPVARLAGTALRAIDADPVARVAHELARGGGSPSELAFAAEALPDDLLAQYALAVHARRTGDEEAAQARYEALLAGRPSDAFALTNLANLHFRAGRIPEAIQLYERASGLLESPTLFFNLSQAYARSFQMEEFENALQRAQSLGAVEASRLSRSGDPNLVADLPIPIASFHARLLGGQQGSAFSRELASRLGPGRLGRGWIATATGFAVVALLAALLGGVAEHSSRCSRCGRRICARCDGTVWNSEICEGCHHVFHRTENTDPTLRMARMASLRRRESRLDRLAFAASLVIPGASGILARRPDLGFLGVLLFTAAVALLVWRKGVVPDPLALGALGPLAFLLAAGIVAFAYVAVVVIGIAIRRNA